MSGDDKLHQALQLLYDSSSRFHVSVDTIQRLAKHLTLDTFVDAEALASPTSRLSIAGQLLLLDVDFSADDHIHDIALSSGSHLSVSSQEGKDPQKVDLAGCLVGDVQESSQERWFVSLKKGCSFSFFRNGNGTCAETILRGNLNGSLLGPFSANLAYLAALDRLSPPEGDLIATMDRIALYLALVHYRETQLDPRNDILSGNKALFGAVQLNDEDSGRLGIFLKFWEKNRHLGEKLGQKYMARMSVQGSQPHVDYFHDIQTKPWRILQKEVVLALDRESLETIKKDSMAQNWRLLVSLDTPISLPKNLVEYLGIMPQNSGKNGLSSEKTNSSDSPSSVSENSHTFTCENGTDRITFYFEDNSPLVLVKEFPLTSLQQLAKIMSALRNQITFSALFHSVSETWKAVSEAASELLPETSKKIRTSLKLSDDVPDEEIMGLNTIPNDIMSTERSESGLEDFMKDEYAENEDDEMEGGKLKELTFSFVEIRYGTPHSDYLIRITGSLSDSENIDTQVVIRNGDIVQDGDVDMDSSVHRLFVQALAFSEDIPLALKALNEGGFD